MLHYTIMEFDLKTGKYTTIGHATGEDSGEAKTKFLKESEWNLARVFGCLLKAPCVVKLLQALSSVGQSIPLITGWSWVQVPQSLPF